MGHITAAGASDLWLGNKAGMVLHLAGTQTGGVPSLGGGEILIPLPQ